MLPPASPLPRTLRRSGARLELAFGLAIAACDGRVFDDDRDAGGDSETTGIATDATTGAPLCEDDVWEPNQTDAAPSVVVWDWRDEWSAYRELADAYLCPGDEDWYSVDAPALDYTIHALYIRALVADAGLCGAACGEPVIPAGPQHAMTLEVYRADTSELLMSQTVDDGVLALDGWGDDYGHALLIRVFSPTASAAYPYRLSVQIRNYEGEDECEC